MSRLATEYLQRECTLPRRVESIEADLANGYLFISLLNQMGLVPEESYEEACDVMNPDAVLNNFRILARSLRPLNVSLTKKDVANIVSETPGASADLVMKIREARVAQTSGKSLNVPPAYKNIIRSVRPKEFVRQSSTGVPVGTPTERFYSDARSVLDRGVFAELDMKCFLQPYGIEQFKNEDQKIVLGQQIAANKSEHRKVVHDATAATRKLTKVNNTDKDVGITQRWAVTEEDKRKRQVRDLQFELATIKIDELRRKKKSNVHRNDQVTGIDAFEVNMKRNGIGGGDDGQTLSTTYEDAELFSTRLGDVAKKNWPSDDDTSNFITALKLRTKENRTARYEKSRRKRRATLVEQSATVDDTDAFEDSIEESKNGVGGDAVLKATLKKERLEKSVSEGIKSRERILEAAEEKIKSFSEQYTSRAAAIDQERRLALDAVLAARAAKVAEKRRHNDKLVRSIVQEMVNDVFDGGVDASKSAPALNTSNPQVLLVQLTDMARARIMDGGAVEGITSLDSWTSHAALAMNIGKWVFVPTSSPPESSLDPQEAKSDAVSAAQKGSMRQNSFLETAQTVLETIVQRSHESGVAEASGAGIQCGISFVLSAAESALLRGTKRVVVLLSNGYCPSREYWNQLQTWTSNSVCLWDTVSVTMVGAKLKPLLEGKKPAINFSSLVSIFSEQNLICPDALASTALSADVLKACAEVVEAADRVLATQNLAAAGPDISLADVTFTNVTCAIALGQSLWIRQFVRDKLSGVDKVDLFMPRFVLVSRLFGCVFSTDSPVFANLVDWFLQGGTRDNAPEGNSALVDAIASDGKAGKKPPAKKGKPGEEPPLPDPSIGAILWMHSCGFRKPCTASRSTPVVRDPTGVITAEFVRYLFECVDLASSKANSTVDLAAVGSSLLDYGVADSVKNAEGLNRKPGESTSKVSVYSLQLVDDETASENALTATSMTHVPISEDLSAIEVVLSVVLDVCGFQHSSSEKIPNSPPVNSIASVQSAAARLLSIKAMRRARLSPQDMLWLLHLTKEHPLDASSIYDVHGTICDARAVELELGGLLILLASYSVSEVDRVMRQLQAKFVASLKTVDKRWFDSCAHAVKAIATNTPESEEVILEDLVTSLGNIIDDRHMMWLSSLSKMEEEGASVILDLQNRMLEVTDLYAHATFEVLRTQKLAAETLASWLAAAGYSQVPWADSSPDSSPDRKREELSEKISVSVTQLSNDVVGIAQNDATKAVWADLVDMELPQTTDILAIALKCLYCEALSSCLVVVNSTGKCLRVARSAVLETVSKMKANARTRYAYEHEVLGEWGSQLRGIGTKAEEKRGRQFLEAYYFGVSDDVLNDKVPAWSGHNLVEVGDMQLSLAALAALSEEIATTSRAVANRDRAGSKGNESALVAFADNKQDSVKDFVCDKVCAAVKIIAQKGTPPIPRGWRNQKRVHAFVGSFVDEAAVNSLTSTFGISEVAATIVRDIVTTLLYAAIPKAAPTDYIARLAKTVCVSSGDSRLIHVPSITESPLTVDNMLKRVTADTKLAAGWWEATAAPEVVKEALEGILGSVAWCCVDSSGNLDLTAFLLSLCKCPSMHQSPSFEQNLLMSPAGQDNDVVDFSEALPSMLSDGYYRAVSLACRIEIEGDRASLAVRDTPPGDILRSAGTIKLGQLMGPDVNVSQLAWLGAKGSQSISSDGSIFRAQIGMCRRSSAISSPVEQQFDTGESKGESSEKCETESWETIDITPAGLVLPVVGAWALEANKQIHSAAFNIRKYC